MISNKKGTGESNIGKWIIVIALLFVAFVLIRRFIIEEGGSQFNAQTLKIKTETCQLSGTRAQAEGTKFTDNDFGANKGDGFPDSCDICLGGNNKVDSDLDGMPDACDNDPNSVPKKGITFKEVCENQKDKNEKRKDPNRPATWIKETNQCKLDCYDKKDCQAST